MNIEELRQNFPGLNQKIYGKDLVYLDSAATTQRSRDVVHLFDELSEKYNANVHRSVYTLAHKATEYMEQTRDFVKSYINANSREEIVFTTGTTFSINLVAHSFGDVAVSEGDNIIIGASEHHSNIVPWQLLSQRKKCEIRVLPICDNGIYDISALDYLIDERTKLICVAQISNVLGVINPISDIINIAHKKGVKVLVDGAQGMAHMCTDVQSLDCDFYAFSGHKLYASTGVGILYAKREILELMQPFLGGGEMIGTVSFENSTYADLPYKFEAGTPNFNAIPTLKPALELLGLCHKDSEINQNLHQITEYVYSELKKDSRITILGDSQSLGACCSSNRIPLFSISVQGVHHEDLAVLMDKMGVAVRTGHLCAEPLIQSYGLTGVLRASFFYYNTIQEAEYFISCLNKAINMLL